MSRRKWGKSTVEIANLISLQVSIDAYGGIWMRYDTGRGKFLNKAWVLSQQLGYLLRQIKQKRFWFPQEIRLEEKLKCRRKALKNLIETAYKGNQTIHAKEAQDEQ